jgi:hypothetical protein
MREEYYTEQPLKPAKRSTVQTCALLTLVIVTAQIYTDSFLVTLLAIAYGYGVIFLADKSFKRWRVKLSHRQFYITLSIVMLVINLPMAIIKLKEVLNATLS